MAASVFDRLARQGTAASDARLAEGKALREKHRRTRAAAAAASSPMSMGNPAKVRQVVARPRIPPRDRSGPTSAKRRPARTPTKTTTTTTTTAKSPKTKSPWRTPEQRDDFYDRLSRQETISSAAHHIKIPNLGRQGPGPSAKSPQEKTPVSAARPGGVFARLHEHETAAARGRHLKEKTPPPSPRTVAGTSPPPSFLKRLEAAASADDSPYAPVPIRMKLHIRTKEETKAGKPYVNLDLSGVDVRHHVNAFRSGKTSARPLASDVINALFRRDFTPGRHWDVGAATVEELDPIADKEGEKISIVKVEKQAIWDWKDIYSVASAKATIKFSSEDIHVDEYSYYVSG